MGHVDSVLVQQCNYKIFCPVPKLRNCNLDLEESLVVETGGVALPFPSLKGDFLHGTLLLLLQCSNLRIV